MINLNKCREIRIKRANTDWWINEKSIVGDNGLTYIAYMTDMGEIHIKELDAKCSRTPSRASSRAIRFETIAGEMPRARAPALRLPARIMPRPNRPASTVPPTVVQVLQALMLSSLHTALCSRFARY